ncbi:hypothetical protein Y032_0098g3074 [Ancylostoma ceylanicum]|uniref:RING-type domain-containing protein n=1 Tax=Ancylostoma ceylanicum TaxID=53326 RepID=A0A016TJ51_9BILA|nr:hypothetical protein Y032_0098g3074 [Ancylostoma ceylanicum]
MKPFQAHTATLPPLHELALVMRDDISDMAAKEQHWMRMTITISSPNLATCLVCNFSFCTKCHRAYHGVDACRPTVVAVSRMIENEDGTMTFKKITVDEYLAADDDQRKEMAWWYGGMERLEAAMDEAMGRDRSKEWLDQYTRACPACGVSVFKEEGCNMVYCPCGTFFCFGCGENFSDGKTDKTMHWASLKRENTPCSRRC